MWVVVFSNTFLKILYWSSFNVSYSSHVQLFNHDLRRCVQCCVFRCKNDKITNICLFLVSLSVDESVVCLPIMFPHWLLPTARNGSCSERCVIWKPISAPPPKKKQTPWMWHITTHICKILVWICHIKTIRTGDHEYVWICYNIKVTNKPVDRGSVTPATPMFCEVKLLFFSMESGGFEESSDGYNSFNSKIVTPIFTAVSQCREQLRFRVSHLGYKVSLNF